MKLVIQKISFLIDYIGEQCLELWPLVLYQLALKLFQQVLANQRTTTLDLIKKF